MSSSDFAFERRLGRVLSASSRVSVVLLAAGLLLLFAGPDTTSASITALDTGLIVLLATPMLPVLVSVVEYLRRRDWLFAGVTLIVLLELAASLLGALRTY